MKRLFEELTVSDHLSNVYNKRQQLGNMNDGQVIADEF